MHLKYYVIFLILILTISCKENTLPKPKAYLSLEYLPASYISLNTNKYNLEYNTNTKIQRRDSLSLIIKYPLMKASIYITYKKINNNLKKLLLDAQDLTYSHTIKADAIKPKIFINNVKRKYGMLHVVNGNAASQIQFYATDSINHFMTGALYFNVKPNYDSIYPAIEYIKKDILKIISSLKWRNSNLEYLNKK